MAQPRIVERGRGPFATLPLLSYGFRPFFLFGAAWAAVVVPLWLTMMVVGVEPAGPFAAVDWHAHEMIFGYLAAVMAGFVLTAVPNWTGRLPISGRPLLGLFALWVAGRVASLLVASAPAALVIDTAFLAALAAAIWREILAGSNFRNLPVAALFTTMAVANAVFHLQASGVVGPGGGVAERLALGAAAVLIALVGGRIVPSFTRNWMNRLDLAPLPAPFGGFDKAAVVAAALACLAWAAAPTSVPAGVLLLAAAALTAVRLARWRGLRTLREPVVAILHVGYLWLAVAFGLLGASVLWPTAVAPDSAMHALAAGAIGTMTLAVMTRASLGHTGRAIGADTATLVIYLLVNAGAAVRVAAPLFGDRYLAALTVGGLMWSGAFAVFVVAYAPVLLRPGLGRL